MNSKHSIDNPDIEIVEAAEVRELPGGRHRGAPLSGLALVLSLLAVIVVAASLVFGYQHWKGLQASLARANQAVAQASQYQSELQTQLSAALQTFEAQKSILEEEQQRLAEQQRMLAEQENRLTQERTRLDEQNVRMQETLGAVHQRLARNTTEWMAVEAEYLLQVANHRLRLEGDVRTALLALQSADSRLKDTGDPGWITAREAIAGDIARLKTVQRMDRAGVAAQLSSLAEQVKSLRFAGGVPAPRAEETAPETAQSPQGRSMETLLDDAWNSFKSLVVIRHHGQPVTAMLPPDQQFFVYQNLRLQFEAARMALLRRDQSLYSASLQAAEQWIRDFFDPEDPATQSMLRETASLGPLDVNPALPDISGSLAVLQERLKQASGGGAAE